MQYVYPKAIFAALAAFVIAVLLALMAADPSSASSRIRAGNCNVYQTAQLDPIVNTSGHEHHFIMGSVNANSDTGFDYKSRAFSSCRQEDNWATSGGWYPKPKSFSSDKSTVYYRDPGDKNNLRPIPTDLRMLNTKVQYRGDFTTVNFGNCVKTDGSGNPILDSTDHKSHIREANANNCPSGYTYRIPDISYLIHWSGGLLTASTLVSSGSGQYTSGSFHADYHAGVQNEFNQATSAGKSLIDLCLNDVPDSVVMASTRCGVGA